MPGDGFELALSSGPASAVDLGLSLHCNQPTFADLNSMSCSCKKRCIFRFVAATRGIGGGRLHLLIRTRGSRRRAVTAKFSEESGAMSFDL